MNPRIRNRFTLVPRAGFVCMRPNKKTGEMEPDPGRTKQQMRDECDINRIMSRYQKTGTVAHVNNHSAQYGYASSLDFRECMEVVRQGEEMFAALPSSVRKKFSNSPAEFLAFVQDEKNMDAMRELGLAKAKAEMPVPAGTGPGNGAPGSAPAPASGQQAAPAGGGGGGKS